MNKFLKAVGALLIVAAVSAASIFLVDLGAGMYTVALVGNTPVILNQGQVVAPADPNAKMRVVIGMKIHDQPVLDKLIRDQGDPTSPEYRKWLTPADFTARFSPSQADVDETVNYFTSKGLTLVEVTPNRLLIVLEGTAAQMQAGFNVRLNQYRMANVSGIPNGIYVSNASDPRVPSRLANVIDSVSGLSDVTVMQSRAIRGPAHAGATITPPGYSPQAISATYGYPTPLNPESKAGYTGAGRTIAIATAYGYLQQDVEGHWRHFGIKRTGTLTNVPIGGTTSEINSETTLDIETAGALAPGADVIVYEGVDPKFATFSLVYNRVVTDNKADVMSVSWGACEEFTGPAHIRTESMILRQAASQGIATFVASGDDGAYDCKVKLPYFAIDYPSADPNVTAVGGTSLYAFGGMRFMEVAWAGSGGGMSKNFGRPFYQYGKGVGDIRRRHVPDVALNADPNTGYAIRFDSKWEQFGGTSVAAPAWGAYWAVANEAANDRLGPANPTLYRASRTPERDNYFFDITVGANGAGLGTGYPALPGYDHTTGLGTPNGTALIEWIKKDASQPQVNVPTSTPPADGSPVTMPPDAPTAGDPIVVPSGGKMLPR